MKFENPNGDPTEPNETNRNPDEDPMIRLDFLGNLMKSKANQ